MYYAAVPFPLELSNSAGATCRGFRALPRSAASPGSKRTLPRLRVLFEKLTLSPSAPAATAFPRAGLAPRGREMEGLRLGDLVTFELHFPVSAQPIWVDTTVRYLVMHRRSGECGFQFLSLSEDQLRLIRRYCRLQTLKKRWWS